MPAAVATIGSRNASIIASPAASTFYFSSLRTPSFKMPILERMIIGSVLALAVYGLIKLFS
jgi:uncharacterized protein (DUF2062 family)